MNIIGICGTHGTGKSTILQGVEAQGYPVNKTQISRTVQSALGWSTLHEAQRSVQNMWDLQETILCVMWDRDTEIDRLGILTTVERTPADVWAYTEMWCTYHGVDFKTDRQATNFKARCLKMAESYARFIIVEPTDAIPFEADPNRATLLTRKYVHSAINKFIGGAELPAYLIQGVSRQERVAEAVSTIILERARLGL